VWAVGGNGEARAISIADVAGYNSISCLSLHIAAAAQHWFTSFFSEISNQATLKSPGFDNGNLDRPKPRMLIPNMFCTFVQIPHHDWVPFSALQINDLFLWSVGINENTTTRQTYIIYHHIYPNFQGSKIIEGMILEPSTAP